MEQEIALLDRAAEIEKLEAARSLTRPITPYLPLKVGFSQLAGKNRHKNNDCLAVTKIPRVALGGIVHFI